MKYELYIQFSSVQSLSRVQLCDPMNRSMPGLPVHQHLPEFTQTHVHRVSDAIQPSHPLLFPSPGDLLDLRTKPVSPSLQVDSFSSVHSLSHVQFFVTP